MLLRGTFPAGISVSETGNVVTICCLGLGRDRKESSPRAPASPSHMDRLDERHALQTCASSVGLDTTAILLIALLVAHSTALLLPPDLQTIDGSNCLQKPE